MGTLSCTRCMQGDKKQSWLILWLKNKNKNKTEKQPFTKEKNETMVGVQWSDGRGPESLAVVSAFLCQATGNCLSWGIAPSGWILAQTL